MIPTSLIFGSHQPIDRSLFYRLLLVLLAVFCASVARAESAEAMIAKARQFIGDESQLKAIETLKYEGSYQTPNGQSGKLTMYYEKPNKQRIERKTRKGTIVKATDGYEGYQLLIPSQADKNGNRNSRLNLIGTKELRQLMTNARENLFFYNGYKHSRGKIVESGSSSFRGKEAYLITFEYPNETQYKRYFDPDTGRLLGTKLTGDKINIEKDYMEVEGLKFPKVIEVYQGEKLQFTATFENIEVNPKFEKNLFDFPKMSP